MDILVYGAGAIGGPESAGRTSCAVAHGRPLLPAHAAPDHRHIGEIGQIAFVGVCFAMAKSWKVLEMHWPRWVLRAPGYVVGISGAYWTIQRVAMMFAGR